MLYVSRCVDGWSVGVVDTDDGVETVMNIPELVESLYDTDIKIAGIEQVVYANSACNTKVFPYQLPECETSRQMKLRVLTGVRTVIYNGVLVGISMEGSKLSKPLKLRLSDLAHECGEAILDWAIKDDYDGSLLTLIVDDKLKFGPESFYTPVDGLGFHQNVTGIILDLQECTADDDLIFETYMDIDVLLGDAEKHIVDNKKRKKRMLQMLDEV